jgi:hypothetical protein
METTFAAFWAPIAWCAVGVPLFFSYFVHLYGKSRWRQPTEVTASPPRHGMVVLPVLFLFVVSGAAVLWWLLEVGTFSKLAFCIVYGIVMAIGLLLVAAHASGDMWLRNGF